MFLSPEPFPEGGAIIQVVTAVSTTLDSTQSTSLVDSSLSASITPLAADSTLLIQVDGDVSHNAQGGATDERRGWVAIHNSTDAVVVAEQIRGRVLTASSSGAAASSTPIALRGRYVVNSTATRQFKLRYRSQHANVQSQIVGTRTGGVLMTIVEVAA